MLIWLRALRAHQWIKNLVVFAALVFSGALFNGQYFATTVFVFVIFCILSSTSYLFNDIIDYEYDRKHPRKKFRPIAKGDITIPQATFVAFLFAILGLLFSLTVSLPLFFLSLGFLSLHVIYSIKLKHVAIVDIFVISFSFILRAFAGAEFSNSNLHIPIWLILTIFFVALFMATVKRRAELSLVGLDTRKSLDGYNVSILDLLMSMFGTASILSYCAYTYFEPVIQFESKFGSFVRNINMHYDARKWFTITIPLFVYIIARYAQLFFKDRKGEEPERTLTQDKPLIFTLILWAVLTVLFLYIL